MSHIARIDSYTMGELGQFVYQLQGYLAGVSPRPFGPEGACLACKCVEAEGHYADCPAARLIELSKQIALIGQYSEMHDSNVVRVYMLAVSSKQAWAQGTVGFYNVALVSKGTHRCSCGHTDAAHPCDHVRRATAFIKMANTVMQVLHAAGAQFAFDGNGGPNIQLEPTNKGDHDGYRDEGEPPMPDTPPDDGYVPGENLSVERIAELQRVVGGSTTPEAPFDSATGRCGKCGGVWGHTMGCVWA